VKTLSVTDVARNFGSVLDALERDQEEIVLVRNQRHVARLRSLAARLRKTGRDPLVRVNDLWLAAQTIQGDFRLLTSNAKDFADIPGLKLVVLKLP
jgi:predicted nucleic acid-binding protein